MVHIEDVNITRGLCPSSVVLFQPPVVHDLLYEETEDTNGNKSVHCCRDIKLLLNAERLKGLGEDTVKKYLETVAPYSSGLSELKKKVSDADLLTCIKSRYLQSQSELGAWISSLDEKQAQIIAEIQANKTEQDEAASAQSASSSDNSASS